MLQGSLYTPLRLLGMSRVAIVHGDVFVLCTLKSPVMTIISMYLTVASGSVTTGKNLVFYPPERITNPDERKAPCDFKPA